MTDPTSRPVTWVKTAPPWPPIGVQVQISLDGVVLGSGRVIAVRPDELGEWAWVEAVEEPS